MADIFSFSYLKEKLRIAYYSDKEDAFMIHTKSVVTKLKSTPEGIYAFKNPTSYLKDMTEKKNMILSRDKNVM